VAPGPHRIGRDIGRPRDQAHVVFARRDGGQVELDLTGSGHRDQIGDVPAGHRVVQLGDGDYEVHYIGVNWPHHIFVNQSFQVIGANS